VWEVGGRDNFDLHFRGDGGSKGFEDCLAGVGFAFVFWGRLFFFFSLRLLDVPL
jgi:hypothetical protein